MSEPIESEAIRSAVAGALEVIGPERGARVALLINDPDRATPTGVVLSALLAARPDLRLEAVVACGTHRHPEALRRAHVARHGLERVVSVRWHDGAGGEETLPGPSTPALAVGSVEPHWFAGWTGAHKTITVGVWPRARIEANHARALSGEAVACRAWGNPIFEDLAAQLAAWQASRSAPAAAINLVADEGGVHAAAGGEVLASLFAVIPAARARYVTTLSAPLDRLLARVSAPLDRSLYQALKGVKNNAPAVRDGGALVLVAGCPDAVGIDHFMRLLEDCPDWASAREAVRTRGYRLGDHKAVRLRHLTDARRVQLGLVAPGFPPEAAACCRMALFDDEAAALTWARAVAPGPGERALDDAGNRVLSVAPVEA